MHYQLFSPEARQAINQLSIKKSMEKTCFVIVGPTAVGKTSFAIHLTQTLTTQIISADSRQCYKELNIGVAKPSTEQLTAIHHYFINSHSIYDDVNAATFEAYALDAVDKIFKNSNYAVMVGGTGLYIKAFCEGLDKIPAIDITLRAKIIQQYEQEGLTWLQQEMQRQDPDFFAGGETKNPQRLMRALEVKLSTGQSITHFQTSGKKQRSFHIVKVGLQLPRELLYQQINNRVDEMIKAGLIDEVRALLSLRHLNALQTVGYKELFDFFDEKITLAQAIEAIKLNTRHYAKRQMTWFNKDKAIQWLDASKQIDHLVEQTISATKPSRE